MLWLQEQEKQSRQEVERMTQLVQRMCNQNLQHDLISDFKACTTLALKPVLGGCKRGAVTCVHITVASMWLLLRSCVVR